MLAAPIIGRLADRYGKLTVYRVIALVSALLMAGDHALAARAACRRRGGVRRADGLQRGPHDRGHGHGHQQRRAAPPRRIPERQLLGAAHRQRRGRVSGRNHHHAIGRRADSNTLARSAGSPRPRRSPASGSPAECACARADLPSAEKISLAAAAEATADAGEPMLNAAEES